MEPKRAVNVPLVSFASTILGISVSIFLNNLLSLMQVFSYILDYRIGIIVVESFFAYLVGFLVIASPHENSNSLNARKVLNILLIVSITILLIIIGIAGFSFKFLIILSFTTILLALMYSTLNIKTSYIMIGKRIPILFVICILFCVLALPAINPSNANTIILLSDFEVRENNGNSTNSSRIYADIYTTLFQEKGIAKDIKVEMIPMGDCSIEKNTEFIKIVNILENNDRCTLHWRVCFPLENKTHTLYIFIWDNFEDRQYKMKITKDDSGWNCSSPKDVGLREYLKVFYYTKSRRIYELFQFFSKNAENS